MFIRPLSMGMREKSSRAHDQRSHDKMRKKLSGAHIVVTAGAHHTRERNG
jgi:hypothetical protein